MKTFYISNNFPIYLSGKEIISFPMGVFKLINREKKRRDWDGVSSTFRQQAWSNIGEISPPV
jgi:hypothetical protein